MSTGNGIAHTSLEDDFSVFSSITNVMTQWDAQRVCAEAILILETDPRAEDTWSQLKGASTDVICTILSSPTGHLNGDLPVLYILIGEFEKVKDFLHALNS